MMPKALFYFGLLALCLIGNLLVTAAAPSNDDLYQKLTYGQRVVRQAGCANEQPNAVCDESETYLSCSLDCPLVTCGDGECKLADGESEVTCPYDCRRKNTVCGDNICHPSEVGACAADCPTTQCGNRICESGESIASCPLDCSCGNGICESTLAEAAVTCPQDCGCNNNGICEAQRQEMTQNCPTDCHCGNGICEVASGETTQTCPIDCPATPTSTSSIISPTLPLPSPSLSTVVPSGTASATNAAATGTWPASKFACNNDGYCDSANGESSSTCPVDCSGTNNHTIVEESAVRCDFDSKCDPGESSSTCPDCLVKTFNNTVANIKAYIQANPSSFLVLGKSLRAGQSLNSTCGISLLLDDTGDIIISTATGDILWTSNSAGQCANDCELTLDENDQLLKLQVRMDSGMEDVIWKITKEPAVIALLMANGNFVVVNSRNIIVFQTGKVIRMKPAECVRQWHIRHGKNATLPTTLTSLPVTFSDPEQTEAVTTTSPCGNGVCDSGEDSTNCPADCGSTTKTAAATKTETPAKTSTAAPSEQSESHTSDVCGDGVCQSSENETSCSQDCRRSSSINNVGSDLLAGLAVSSDTGPLDSKGGTCGNNVCEASEDINICPVDCGGCNHNNVCDNDETDQTCGDCQSCNFNGQCEPELKETTTTCPSDCSSSIETSCNNNGVCESFESPETCPGDCPVCGNGVCEVGEDANSCTADCGCGNGICDVAEDSTTCPQDCPATARSNNDQVNLKNLEKPKKTKKKTKAKKAT